MGGQAFPATRRSVVFAVRSGDPAERGWALETLLTQYWKPVYKYLRLRHHLPGADAEDLTQAFFVHALGRETFADYDPGKASFRTFLRVCLDRFVSNEKKAAGRLKRGGGVDLRGLDFEGAEGELLTLEVPDDATPDDTFQREWVRSFFGLVVEALEAELRSEGKEVYFTVFERYDLDPPATGPPTYKELALELGLKATDVTNHLASARRRFRRLAVERLREVTASDEELEREARALFGGGA